MKITYEKLWHILLTKNMTREDLRIQSGVSSNTIAKLGRGDNLTTDVLLKICKVLKCGIEDILETKFIEEGKKDDF
ncbi:helix-turn-helix transcriptional regulator [Streptococcus anginosus]|uniref:helix-turn-helix domain-containing protein n=1 Tax=Streptococcus anginosus TaxID=1328 RepID=UPI0012482110|nr:helix-turn-helix transcriptional regulator [Streptococcus anginosus]KAA9246571.1 helix-turn-helix transcriptional regulator [Streptococcus anginosus]MED5833148.1 helix-turn-helix transcriptional regulator [Streptococcus anginosus]MED5835102.1 helix-turn-helix transcriptional regulator [Streptococcus anginosus]